MGIPAFGYAAVLTSVFGVATAAAAAGPSSAVTMPTDPQVVGGAFAQPCEWPTTIALRGGGCSGTLIHPQVALSAAHCGTGAQIQLGEDWDSAQATAPVEFCERFPSWQTGNGTDIMVCKLAGSVGLPIVPVMHGCDRREVEIGDNVVPVGFGLQSEGNGPIGDKKWYLAEILGFPGDGAMVGIVGVNPDEGICNGDSGGSMYFQMSDGTWRMMAITSTGVGGCPGTNQFVPTWLNAVEFIEETTGIDVTPCHDTDGTWNPGPDCTGFPLDPGNGSGLSWSNGCVGGPVSGPVATCGPAFGEPPDTNPPEVAITAPDANAELPADIGSVPVTLVVDDPDGWGVRDIRFVVDGSAGMQEVLLEAPPWDVGSVELPQGEWLLTAVARDWSGNEAEHAISVYVGIDAPETTGAASGDESPQTSGTGGTDTAGGDGGGGGGGCSVASEPAKGGRRLPAWAWMVMLAFGSRSRR